MSAGHRRQVSVLIPTFRRPTLLARAIASAVEQVGVEVHVRVFDNCSGDGTADVVASFARRHPNVRYHCHDSNIGATANFAHALGAVDTEYFSILSDDDYLLPGFYASAVDALEREPSASFWAGITLSVDESGAIWDARLARWPRDGLYSPPEGPLAMTGGLAPTWTGVLFRRRTLETFGMPDLAMLGPSDLDYLLRLAARTSFVVERRPAAVFMLNTVSYSATEPLSAFWPGWRKMIANAAASPLEAGPRELLVRRLEDDARRMLFRRGANALSKARLDFAHEAASHLRSHYRAHAQAAMLDLAGHACRWLPGAQRLVSIGYRRAEQRIVASRESLTRDYAALLRPLPR